MLTRSADDPLRPIAMAKADPEFETAETAKWFQSSTQCSYVRIHKQSSHVDQSLSGLGKSASWPVLRTGLCLDGGTPLPGMSSSLTQCGWWCRIDKDDGDLSCTVRAAA
jgi:hypothetical protein